jgi:hypothetical protein
VGPEHQPPDSPGRGKKEASAISISVNVILLSGVESNSLFSLTLLLLLISLQQMTEVTVK